MKIKAIFFDMDGVLLDSMSAHVNSWKLALEEVGFSISEFELKKRGGLSFREIVREIAEINGLKNISLNDVERIYERKKEIFRKFESSIKAFDILDNLEKLKQKGIICFVVTGSIRELAQKSLDHFFPNVFDQIISSDDVERGKPYSDPYLKALDISGFSKDECLVVEDAPLGIKSAKEAGLKVLALETTMDKGELGESNMIFKSHKELFEYLDNLITN